MSKVILSLGGTQVTHELTEDMTTIGRAPESAIRIDDPSVSSRHAQISQVGETFHLQDLESTNGTRVNGETITSAALRAGDRVRFGKVEARFEGEVPAGAQPLPALQESQVRPAETSARPADFENASPFPKRSSKKDPVRTAIYAAAAVAILAFIASMLSLAMMRPPIL
ncbi:MAG: FHA domain-containing protein [Verrucomicrobiota bacterium]|nr:FHA domain-containing protein [Verrucomicrobiota bacterium]